MLNSLEIENFKGISTRQRVDFAPLTLLFGANSAGKSTILQALLYLHEVIERGLADVDRTELGGDVVELGGFARLVHRHELERAITLRADFDTLGSLERFGRDLTSFPFPDLEDDIDSAWIELTTNFRTTAGFTGAIVDRVTIGVNGEREPLVWIELGPAIREGKLLYARINLGHPLLATGVREHDGAIITEGDGTSRPLTTSHASAEITEAWERIAVPEEVLHRSPDGGGFGGGSGSGFGLGDGSGFGDGRSLPLFALARSRMSALPHPDESLRVIPDGDDSPENVATVDHVRTFLEMVVLGTTAQLASFLRDATYIGPLRTIPPRGFLYERAGRVANWADGLGAWDLLLADRHDRVAQTNHWLRRLGAGCQVVVQQLFDHSADAEELSQGHVDKTVRRLLLDTSMSGRGLGADLGSQSRSGSRTGSVTGSMSRSGSASRSVSGSASVSRSSWSQQESNAPTLVLPSEVGAGISQVMPVIVAALEPRAGLTLIEQPELHIHPMLQTNLGDLFIVASAHRQFLIETHSEHLILRALRRIRETSASELDEGDPPFTADKLSVMHVEATDDGTTFKQLRVDLTGEFVDRWPHGFFEERAKELF